MASKPTKSELQSLPEIQLSQADLTFPLATGSAFHISQSMASLGGETSSQVYTLHEFESKERLQPPKVPFGQRVAKKLHDFQCGKKQAKKALYTVLPSIRVAKNYNMKEDIIYDLVCGVTIGLVNIPLSMAYALLYGIQPLYSLYGGFIPAMLYAFLGTSQHVSYGTLAITGLLVGNGVNRGLNTLVPPDVLAASSKTGQNYSSSVEDFLNEAGYTTADAYVQSQQVSLCLIITFWAGIFQFLIGLLRLGHLTIYLADAMVAGYTTATVLFVFASQLKSLLGLSFESPTGYFNLFRTFYQVFKHIGETNLVTLLISGICMICLAAFKLYINPYLMKKIRSPFPIEVLLVLIAIVVSYFMDLQHTAHVKVVGVLATGLPPPILPTFELTSIVLQESFVIGIVNYGVTISLAQVLARKYAYEVDPNQEAMAYGISNVVGSFFQCVVTGGSVSRTAVQETLKARSQLVGFLSSIIMMIVLLTIVHLFGPLPLAVLASIIAIGLLGVVEQFKEPFRLWKISRYDCLIWVGAFTATILLDVDIGLLIGLLFSFFVVVLRTQTPESHLLGNISGTDTFKNIDKYRSAKEIPTMKIYRFGGPIHFANSSVFRADLYKLTGVNPRKMLIEKSKLDRKKRALEGKLADTLSQERREKIEVTLAKSQPTTTIEYIILDLSTCPYIDYGGLRLLKQVIQEYKRVGVTVLLSACPSKVRNILVHTDFYKEYEHTVVYLSIRDAVVAATNRLTKLGEAKSFPDDLCKLGAITPAFTEGVSSVEDLSNGTALSSVCVSTEILQKEAAWESNGHHQHHSWL